MLNIDFSAGTEADSEMEMIVPTSRPTISNTNVISRFSLLQQF